MEAAAWIIKYFNADSLEIIFLYSRIKGINESILNSRPIQIPSQLEDEIEINVLMMVINKNKMFRLLKINKVY